MSLVKLDNNAVEQPGGKEYTYVNTNAIICVEVESGKILLHMVNGKTLLVTNRDAELLGIEL